MCKETVIYYTTYLLQLERKLMVHHKLKDTNVIADQMERKSNSFTHLRRVHIVYYLL